MLYSICLLVLALCSIFGLKVILDFGSLVSAFWTSPGRHSTRWACPRKLRILMVLQKNFSRLCRPANRGTVSIFEARDKYEFLAQMRIFVIQNFLKFASSIRETRRIGETSNYSSKNTNNYSNLLPKLEFHSNYSSLTIKGE